MADISLTIDQLNKLFQKMILSMLGYDIDPVLDSSYYFVRVSWPTEGAPAWKIDENICFIQVVERDIEYNRQRDVEMEGLDAENATRITNYTRGMELSLVFYGPASFENAQTVRDKMFYPEFQDMITTNNLYLVPDITSPRRVPELYEGRWWERTDLTLLFNEMIVKELTIPYLKSSEITVDNGEGFIETIDVVAVP